MKWIDYSLTHDFATKILDRALIRFYLSCYLSDYILWHSFTQQEITRQIKSARLNSSNRQPLVSPE